MSVQNNEAGMPRTWGEQTQAMQTASAPFRVKVRVTGVAVDYGDGLRVWRATRDAMETASISPKGASARALRNLGMEVTP